MLNGFRGCWSVSVVATGLAILTAGCQQMPSRPIASGMLKSTSTDGQPLKPTQIADMRIAVGHALEQRGEIGAARAAYLEGLQQDPSRADACERVAVLFDQEGKFEESGQWYDKARKGRSNNPDFHCNQGYSYYLQGRWAEAERSLHVALGLDPEHGRSHINLGLVLVQVGRENDALAQFRLGGCREAEAHNNLAFALTLKGDWPAAHAQYEQALAADPSSATARSGLQQLTSLMGKCDPTAPSGRATALTKTASAPSTIAPVGWQAPPAPGK